MSSSCRAVNLLFSSFCTHVQSKRSFSLLWDKYQPTGQVGEICSQPIRDQIPFQLTNEGRVRCCHVSGYQPMEERVRFTWLGRDISRAARVVQMRAYQSPAFLSRV